MERANRSDDPGRRRLDDYLDEVLKQSFPASDPPSSWSGRDPRDGDDR